MTPDELKFFLRYIGRQYIYDVKNVFKGIGAIARPKVWFFIFSIILVWQVGFVRDRATVLLTLVMIVFIWAWDIYEQGHWRGEMRKEFYDKIKRKQQEHEYDKKQM